MIEVSIISQKKSWEKFILNYSDANFLHSWNWGLFQKSLGKKIFRLGFYLKKKLMGVALLVKHEAKRGNYLECGGGPLIDWNNPHFFSTFIEKVKEISRQENCLFVRVRPQIPDTLANRLVFKNNGFIPAPMHLHAELTLSLDLTLSEEQLLRQMRKNTRYLVKKALKLNLEVVQSKNIKDIKYLYQLQMETVARRHFIPFSYDYFKKEMEAFLPQDQISLFLVKWRKKVLAAALIVFYKKEAIYHYAGSSSCYRKIPASYLLQWEAIREAKKRNCLKYNLWGVAPLNKKNHRFAGLSVFKRGFGGQEFAYLHAHDLPLSFKYWPIWLLETLRKHFRHL